MCRIYEDVNYSTILSDQFRVVSKNLPECDSVVFSPDCELGILGDESDSVQSQLHDSIHDFNSSRDGAWVGSSRLGKAPSTEDGGGREAREHATSKWKKTYLQT